MTLQNLLQDRLKDRECLHCGRRLTDPESIKDKLGPVCRHKVMMKYAKLQASTFWTPDEDYYLEIADRAFTELPELDYVLVGGSYHCKTLLAIRDSNGDPMAVSWTMTFADKPFDYNEDALPWIDAVKKTFKTDTLHECIHEDDERLGLLDEYWGPCANVTKHPNAPDRNAGETWGQHYSHSAWGTLDTVLIDITDGVDFFEESQDRIQARKDIGLEYYLMEWFYHYMQEQFEQDWVNEFANCPDTALEMCIGHGEDLFANREETLTV